MLIRILFGVLFILNALIIKSQGKVVLINGYLKDEQTETAISKVKIKISCEDCFKKINYSDSLFTNSDGYFEYKQKNICSCQLIASKECYLMGKANINSIDIPDKEIRVDVYIRKTPATEKDDYFSLVNFNINSSKLLKSEYQNIDKLVEMLNDNPTVCISVNGHCDKSELDQDELCKKRSQKIIEYLINKGIDKQRLETKVIKDSLPNYAKGLEKYYNNIRILLIEENIIKLPNDSLQTVARLKNCFTSFSITKTDYKK